MSEETNTAPAEAPAAAPAEAAPAQAARNNRKTRRGTVVKKSGDKTVSVLVERRYAHPVYGKQITVAAYEATRPETKSGVERFLASGLIRGVGPAPA